MSKVLPCIDHEHCLYSSWKKRDQSYKSRLVSTRVQICYQTRQSCPKNIVGKMEKFMLKSSLEGWRFILEQTWHRYMLGYFTKSLLFGCLPIFLINFINTVHLLVVWTRIRIQRIWTRNTDWISIRYPECFSLDPGPTFQVLPDPDPTLK